MERGSRELHSNAMWLTKLWLRLPKRFRARASCEGFVRGIRARDLCQGFVRGIRASGSRMKKPVGISKDPIRFCPQKTGLIRHWAVHFVEGCSRQNGCTQPPLNMIF